MPDSKRVYESLLQRGFSKEEIDTVLHAFTLLRLKGQTDSHLSQVNNTSSFTFFCSKSVRLLQQLTAKGLYLLKTQFAKKPKNPV